MQHFFLLMLAFGPLGPFFVQKKKKKTVPMEWCLYDLYVTLFSWMQPMFRQPLFICKQRKAVGRNRRELLACAMAERETCRRGGSYPSLDTEERAWLDDLI